ncbi:MAG TPA: M56 family metallopeptidase [Chthonomonadaceae bacterium]|nr:M56 family metallopeptidase [Chthonomonadaceae bacterium]
MICSLALIAARYVFRRHPSLRYTVCLAGLVGILLIPLVVGIQSRVGVSLWTLSLPQSLSVSSVLQSHEPATFRMRPEADPAVQQATASRHETVWFFWALCAVWAAGVVCGAVRFASGCRAVFRLVHGLRPWALSAHRALLQQVERILGCPLPPIFTSREIALPVSIGLLRPRVILPEGLAETLSSTQLRHVLLHEGAHIAFRHPVGGLAERVARLLFWPHPLVSALCQELAWAREEVCDNVASQEDGAACYARTLLAIAQGVSPAPNLTSSLALLGPGTSLEERITGLLDPRRSRMVRVTRGMLWAVTGVVVCAVVSTVAIRVVAAEGSAKQDAAGASSTEERSAGRQAEVNRITEGGSGTGAFAGGSGIGTGSVGMSGGSMGMGGNAPLPVEAGSLPAGDRGAQPPTGLPRATSGSHRSHATRLAGRRVQQEQGPAKGGAGAGSAPMPGMMGGAPGAGSGFTGGAPGGMSGGGAGAGFQAGGRGAGVGGPGLSPGGPGGVGSQGAGVGISGAGGGGIGSAPTGISGGAPGGIPGSGAGVGPSGGTGVSGPGSSPGGPSPGGPGGGTLQGRGGLSPDAHPPIGNQGSGAGG